MHLFNSNKLLRSIKGVRQDLLPGYLNEFMWRERVGQDKFEVIICEISRQYLQFCNFYFIRNVVVVSNLGSSILYTCVKDTTPGGGEV